MTTEKSRIEMNCGCMAGARAVRADTVTRADTADEQDGSNDEGGRTKDLEDALERSCRRIMQNTTTKRERRTWKSQPGAERVDRKPEEVWWTNFRDLEENKLRQNNISHCKGGNIIVTADHVIVTAERVNIKSESVSAKKDKMAATTDL